jgi:hypothetical protein
MAYLLTHFWPGGTEEEYRATLAVAHPEGGLPPGQIYHAAGPTDGGFLISAVWDSEDSCNAFLETLMSKGAAEGGLVGPPEARAAEIVNLVTA